MFDSINGLPLHPLVVHAVVVLLPLAVLGTIAIAVRPGWRHTYGPLVVGVAAAATAFIPLATASGEALEDHVPDPHRHAELGDQLIWFAVPLLVATAAIVWIDRRRAAGRSVPGPGFLPTAVTVFAVVAALATGVQVYRVGDSGARAAWRDYSPAAHG